MQKNISWLHLSDSHFGQKYQWLWPNFKSIFLHDLRRLSLEVGSIDLVIFSGDLTQSGQKEEYELLTNALKEIWEMWADINQCPKLFTVPGNHDLVRPTENNTCMKALVNWNKDPQVVEEFWKTPNNQYVNLI